jgi:hypothetical protein
MPEEKEALSRQEFREDIKELKSDMRREIALMVAAGSTISGIAAGFMARLQAYSGASQLLHQVHHLF